MTLASFFAITIACVARTAPNYEPAESVWATFLNSSGWSSGGVAFLTGLVSPNYMYAGIDGALHLAEECQDAGKIVPRALISTLTIGFVTSFAFMIAMLYGTYDLEAVATSPTGYKRRRSSSQEHSNSAQSPHIRNVAPGGPLRRRRDGVHRPPDFRRDIRPRWRPGNGVASHVVARPGQLAPGK